MTNKLLVLGNGFDLSCGLRSAYGDFFDCRNQNLFNNTNFNEIRNYIGLFEAKRRYFASNRFDTGNIGELKNYSDLKKEHPDITKWDIIFLIAEKYLNSNDLHQWQDVEKVIYEVVSILVGPENYVSYLKFEPGNDEEKFKYQLQTYIVDDKNNKEEIAWDLLNELNKFEAIFSDYIYTQLEKGINSHFKGNYFNKAHELLLNLINNEQSLPTEVNILSFNYSAGPRFQSKENIKLKNIKTKILSWNNIHGMACYKEANARHVINHDDNPLPAPIFGIDNHDIAKDDSVDDLRVMFTKAYRIMDNENGTVVKRPVFSNIDEIIVYGHSLGRADYTYFISLFDECNLYDSDVKLTFYFWPGDDKENSVSVQKQRRKYTQAVTNLLNSYGRTSDKAHGENMLTKLELEKRISVRQNPEF